MNGLLICPVCSTESKRYILGSIDEKGYLYVQKLQRAGGTVIIHISPDSFIGHDCGFGTVVNRVNTYTFSPHEN